MQQMKFAVGYQQPENGEPFSHIVSDYRDTIAEVYFPWPGIATGRSELGWRNGAVDWGAQEELLDSLKAIRDMGVRLDLLLNAVCHGGEAISALWMRRICSILDYLGQQDLLPEIVTVASPFVAEMIKRHFRDVEIRASVNMRLDSTLAMEYLSDLFDSFYLRRDLQRDLPTLRRFSAWTKAHGKGLCILANSGCLRHCPYQTFHDNLVAHNAEVTSQKNISSFSPHLCWKLFGNPQHHEEILRGSWIRPEDIALFAPWVQVVKLATRQHPRPRMIIGAYAAGHYDGNLLDLLEPTFSGAFSPRIVDNRAFPENWAESGIAGACAKDCTHCGRCTEVANMVLKSMTC